MAHWRPTPSIPPPASLDRTPLPRRVHPPTSQPTSPARPRRKAAADVAWEFGAGGAYPPPALPPPPLPPLLLVFSISLPPSTPRLRLNKPSMARLASWPPCFRLVVVLVAALVAAAAAGGFPAASCRCIGPGLFMAEELSRGVVAARLRVTGPSTGRGRTIAWPAAVVTAYRGCLPRAIKLVDSGGSCGWGLEEGSDVLLLRRDVRLDAQGGLRVSTCALMRPWARLTPAELVLLSVAPMTRCARRAVRGGTIEGGGGGRAEGSAERRHACARARCQGGRSGGGGLLVRTSAGSPVD